MSWTQKDQDGSRSDVPPELEKEYEKAKADSLPRVQKEAGEGVRPFKQVDVQPVRSPKLYEAEFGVKGEDVIFHFWPWNYHVAEKQGHRTPDFPRGFETFLVKALGDAFEAKRIEMEKDEDVGAIFVRCRGYGNNQFHRELCIRACEKLHKLLGGE